MIEMAYRKGGRRLRPDWGRSAAEAHRPNLSWVWARRSRDGAGFKRWVWSAAGKGVKIKVLPGVTAAGLAWTRLGWHCPRWAVITDYARRCGIPRHSGRLAFPMLYRRTASLAWLIPFIETHVMADVTGM